MKQLVKSVIYQAMPESRKLRYLTYLPSLRRWRANRAGSHPVLPDRMILYEFVNKELGNCAIDYLEFGVYQGESIVYWAKLNSGRDSRFYGFDTFTGLPSEWDKFTQTVKKGAFDAGGAIPHVADQRVSFRKGLFQETLPPFLEQYRGGKSLVIHIDCDLYSSSLYALTKIDHIVKPGTIIIFDEFTGLLHEFRALEDYCAAYMREYEVIGSTPHDVQIAIRMM
jgi:Macrocin-O-methyltransferase (TylF)